MSRRNDGPGGSTLSHVVVPRSVIRTTITQTDIDRSFIARYRGRCNLCNRPILPGERIFKRSGPKAMHLRCDPL